MSAVSRVFLALLALTGLVGCASSPGKLAVPTFDGAVPTLPEAELLAVSEPMRRAIANWPDAPDRQQVEYLNRLVLHQGSGGFDYVEDRTLTAAEAFTVREGNCLAFANLVVALAREAGLPAFFQEATTLPAWDADGDMLIVNRHVNVGLPADGGVVTLDVSRELAESTTGLVRIDDARAAAHFYSNLGAEALLDGDLPVAYAALERAIERSPTASFAWSNLGLVLARNGQEAAAERAYEHALRLNRRNISAMNNLASLYLRQGRESQARAHRRRAMLARANDPWHAWVLGQRALANETPEHALAHFERGVALAPDEARLWLALARAQWTTDRRVDAERSYARARRLAPADRMAALRHHPTIGAYLSALGEG